MVNANEEDTALRIPSGYVEVITSKDFSMGMSGHDLVDCYSPVYTISLISLLITGFFKKINRTIPLVEWELLTFLQHPRSLLINICSGVRVIRFV